jgi:hypothetical protein
MTKKLFSILFLIACFITMHAQNTTGFVRDYNIIIKKFYYRPEKDFSYSDLPFRLRITPLYMPDNEGNLKLRYLQVKVNCGKHIQDRLRIALENGRALTFEKLNLPANETTNVYTVTEGDDYWLAEAQIIAMRYFNDAEYETEGKVIPVDDGLYFYHTARKACGLSIYDIPDYDTLVAAIHTDTYGYPYPKKEGEQKLGFAANPQALPWVAATPEETAQFTITKGGLHNGNVEVRNKVNSKIYVSKDVLACEVVYNAYTLRAELPLEKKKKEVFEMARLWSAKVGDDKQGHPYLESIGLQVSVLNVTLPEKGLVFTFETEKGKVDINDYTGKPGSYTLTLGPLFDMNVLRDLKRLTITGKTDAAINYSFTIQDDKLANFITALRVAGDAQ